MAFDQLANQDFERAVSKGFWRKVLTWFTRENNDLLPFDEVREKIKIQGQHYIGMREIPIDRIIGSVGRYQEFNRIFMPIQSRTRDRWVNIDKAHYEEIPLPPVDLYKIGEAYFVKDGNHRVSVARERGQEFVDAYVTEIEIPVLLTTDTNIDDLDLKKENADFIIQTDIVRLRPSAHIEATIPGLYDRLLEHIDVHRWYMGENREEEVPYPEAVSSWYDNVYAPVIKMIRDYNLMNSFPKSSETDLYLWILEYAGYVRQAYQIDDAPLKKKYNDAEKQLINTYPFSPVKKLIQVAKRNDWLDELILGQERAVFQVKTHIQELRPDSDIEITLPGRYDQILEHVAVHRWYLGEHRQEEVPYEDAVTSWYDQIYLPIVNIIREQQIMSDFPNRKEADLYLWIVKHQSTLQDLYGSEIPIDKAVEHMTGEKRRTSDKKKSK